MSALVVLAAGLGSRFGGPKQVEPFGPSGETLLELNLYDAWRAGLRRAVIVTRSELLAPLRSGLDARIGSAMELEFAVQTTEPERDGSARTKPWGTGHAVLAAAPHLSGPFGVANADDLYGRAAFEALAHSLDAVADGRGDDEAPSGHGAALVAYRLDRTLSPHGGVSRGLCETDPSGTLLHIEEVFELRREPDGVVRGTAGTGERRAYSGSEPVSLNLWGFDSLWPDHLRTSFERFRATAPAGAEHLLPAVVQDAIRRGSLQVRVWPTDAEWTGVTHAADAEPTRHRVAAAFSRGHYPSPLFP